MIGTKRMVVILLAVFCLQLGGQRPPEDRDFRSVAYWNDIYEHRLGSRLYNLEANSWLQESVRHLPPGRALDIGMGDGRNALYLAESGWNVTGVDISDTGVRKAMDRARSQHLRLDARKTTIDAFQIGSNQWDLILLFYVHPLVRSQVARVIGGLAPGGRILLEDFSAEGTSDVDLFRVNELITLFKPLVVRYYEDATSRPDWGSSRESTARRIVRLNAERQ